MKLMKIRLLLALQLPSREVLEIDPVRDTHTCRDNLGIFSSRWTPRFSVHVPSAQIQKWLRSLHAMEPISKIQLLAQVAQHDRVAIRMSNVGWGPARPMGL